jgi:hypothetical protein
MVGVENHDGIATVLILVAIPTTDIPADKRSLFTIGDDKNTVRNYVVSFRLFRNCS